MIHLLPSSQHEYVEHRLAEVALEAHLQAQGRDDDVWVYGCGSLGMLHNLQDLVLAASGGPVLALAVSLEQWMLTWRHELRGGLGALLRASCSRMTAWDGFTLQHCPHLGLQDLLERAVHPAWAADPAAALEIASAVVVDAGAGQVVLAREVGHLIAAALCGLPVVLAVSPYHDAGDNKARVHRLLELFYPSDIPVRMAPSERTDVLSILSYKDDRTWPRHAVEQLARKAKQGLWDVLPTPARKDAAQAMQEVFDGK